MHCVFIFMNMGRVIVVNNIGSYTSSSFGEHSTETDDTRDELDWILDKVDSTNLFNKFCTIIEITIEKKTPG